MRSVGVVLASALTVACAGLLAGCGSSASATPVATTHVTMARSYRFSPSVISVTPGATVTWTNDDNFTHTVRVDGQADHKVGRGESVSITFYKVGTYHYTCTLHPHDMSGRVVVS
jgi:plastocyanin